MEQAKQLWVSDITCICEDFCYLILITDAYSHLVIGYNFGENIDAAFCIPALTMALGGRRYTGRRLMHHADRGLQYCARAYVELLQRDGIAISMSENGDPLQNAPLPSA